MISFELHDKFFSLNINGNYLFMIRAKNVKSIDSIVDFDNKCGLLIANIRNTHDCIYEEAFDFYDVLCDLGISKYRDKYFKDIKKEDICIKNL